MNAPQGNRATNPVGAPPPSRLHARLERHLRYVDSSAADTASALSGLGWHYVTTAWRKLPRSAWRNRDVTALVALAPIFILLGPGWTILAAPLAAIVWLATTEQCADKRIDRQIHRQLRRAVNAAPKVTGHSDIRTPADPDWTPPATVHVGPLTLYSPGLARILHPTPPGELIARNAHLRLPPGIKPEQYDRMVSTMATHFKPAVISLSRSHRHPDLATMRMEYIDYLARTAPWKPRSEISALRVPIGVDRDAQSLTAPIQGKSWLVAGVNGAGKSVFLNSTIARFVPLIRDGLLELYIIDPEEGVDLGWWHHLATKVVTDTQGAWDLIDHFEDLRTERVRDMVAHGLINEPALPPDYPTRVLVVDELKTVMLAGNAERRRKTVERLSFTAEKGRKAGHPIIAATQHPSAEIIPSLIRTQFTHTFGFRVMRSEQHNVIFGEGAKGRHGFDCSEIPPDQPGRCLWSDGSRMTHVRTYWLPPDQLQSLASPGGDGLRDDQRSQANGHDAPLISTLRLVHDLSTNEGKLRQALATAPNPLTIAEWSKSAGVPERSVYDLVKKKPPWMEQVAYVQPRTFRLRERVAV